MVVTWGLHKNTSIINKINQNCSEMQCKTYQKSASVVTLIWPLWETIWKLLKKLKLAGCGGTGLSVIPTPEGRGMASEFQPSRSEIGPKVPSATSQTFPKLRAGQIAQWWDRLACARISLRNTNKNQTTSPPQKPPTHQNKTQNRNLKQTYNPDVPVLDNIPEGDCSNRPNSWDTIIAFQQVEKWNSVYTHEEEWNHVISWAMGVNGGYIILGLEAR